MNRKKKIETGHRMNIVWLKMSYFQLMFADIDNNMTDAHFVMKAKVLTILPEGDEIKGLVRVSLYTSFHVI